MHAKDDALEFHVDDSDDFIDVVKCCPSKATTSIRKYPEAKIRMVLSQDEPHSLNFLLVLAR